MNDGIQALHPAQRAVSKKIPAGYLLVNTFMFHVFYDRGKVSRYNKISLRTNIIYNV